MKLKHPVSLLVTSIVGLCTIGMSWVTASTLTTTDRFNPKTIASINQHFKELRVAQHPRHYDVYMVTGGLNTPSADVLTCDSAGNITLAPAPNREPLYRFHQTATSPACWMVPIIPSSHHVPFSTTV